LPKDEALEKLVTKYILSHSPATLNDFIWWSGLSASDSKLALKMVESKFKTKIIDEKTYYFSDYEENIEDSVFALLAYDEFLISYRDRTAALSAELHKNAVSNNGIFRPIIILNGKVVGIWKGIKKNELILIEIKLFKEIKDLDLIKQAFKSYGKFLDKEIEIVKF